MKAVHVNWTAPHAARHPGARYEMDPLEALTSAAGARFWKRAGGETALFTDAAGLAYYERSGLAEVYDEVDVDVLDDYTTCSRIDPLRAPCTGRMHALGCLDEPFVAMDLDFVLFDAGSYPLTGADLCCFHWELPMPPWYPARDEQFLPDGFALPAHLDFATLVPNIAFLWVRDPTFFSSFAATAVDYVRRAVAQGAPVPANRLAIFADQRLLGMLAAGRGMALDTLVNDIWTCGPHGEHWEALSRGADAPRQRSATDLVAPFWVQDRGRYDPRKETVDCLHLWFEKPLFGTGGAHAPRRVEIVRRLVSRLDAAFPGDPLLRDLVARLPAPLASTVRGGPAGA